jgi:hypothetical protein
LWGWYNRPILAAVPSGLSLTPLRIIKIIKKLPMVAINSFSHDCCWIDAEERKQSSNLGERYVIAHIITALIQSL